MVSIPVPSKQPRRFFCFMSSILFSTYGMFVIFFRMLTICDVYPDLVTNVSYISVLIVSFFMRVHHLRKIARHGLSLEKYLPSLFLHHILFLPEVILFMNLLVTVCTLFLIIPLAETLLNVSARGIMRNNVHTVTRRFMNKIPSGRNKI